MNVIEINWDARIIILIYVEEGQAIDGQAIVTFQEYPRADFPAPVPVFSGFFIFPCGEGCVAYSNIL